MTELADLVLVSSPIGRLNDLSPQAHEVLEAASFWIVEDTRVSGKLLKALDLSRQMVVLNDHTPPHKKEALVERIKAEGPAALLTDAGTPGISDPGAELVGLCREAGLSVDSAPGASAVTNALALSGFYAQRFAFVGFLPRKPGPAKKVLEPFVDSTFTVVLFESPHRIDKTLAVCLDALGDRRVAICREMTKMHQQIVNTTLSELPSESEMLRKGEFTIVIEGERRA
jgi:16S rRNA (cytidine1402-2'-O)-methyltransferase